jgi:hypothetical protein
MRRYCVEKYAAIGLAEKFGGEWRIHRRADSRLVNFETREGRDRRQIGELRAAGLGDRAIRLAERTRDIVVGVERFGGRSVTQAARLGEYVIHLGATGQLRRAGIKKLKADTLRKLIAKYDAGGIAALARRPYAKRGEGAIGASAWAFFQNVKGVGHRLSAQDAFDQVRGYIIERKLAGDSDWAWPALRTVQQRWRQSTPLAARIAIDEGQRKLRAKAIPKVERDRSHVAAGEALTGDVRTLDFFARALGDRGWRRVRLKLTAWACDRSGMFLGSYIGELANSDTILASFKRTCLDAETVPVEVTIDNGRDYKSVGGPHRRKRKWNEFDTERVESAFERLGVLVHYAEPHSPWAKKIESLFRPVKSGFDRFMLAYVGGKPEEKPWDVERWSRVNLMQLPTVEDVREQFALFLDAHHETPGRGIEGLSPRQAFEQFYTTEPRRITRETLDVVCCKIIGPLKVGRDGIRYQREFYGGFDEAVWRMQGEKVWIAVDPIERETVTVCRGDGAPICVARARRMIGQDSQELREAIATQRRFARIANQYPQARDYLLKTPYQQIAHRRKLAAQARQIPDATLPKREAPQTVRVVRPDIAAAVEDMKRAAGGEAIRKLASMNAGAEALNSGYTATLQDLNKKTRPLESEQPVRRVTLEELNAKTRKTEERDGP